MFTRMNAAAIKRSAAALGLTVALALGSGVRAADPIDPRTYLPELKKDDNLFIADIKLPALFKLDALKDLRKKEKLDDWFGKKFSNITIDDIAEVVALGVQNGNEQALAVILFRFGKDLEVKDVVAEAGKTEPKKISGFELFQIGISDKKLYVTKVAPATFAIFGPQTDEKGATAYLETLAKKKPAKYPEVVTAMLKEAGGAELVIVETDNSADDSEAEANSMSVKVGENVKFSGTMKFKTAEAAEAFVKKVDSGDQDLHIPIADLKVKGDGDTVKVSAAATKEEVVKMVDDFGKMLPVGGDE